jgi:tRNA pseudouridine55 synthase
LGEATKLAGFLLADDTSYRGSAVLGVETNTLDADGDVVRSQPEAAASLSREQVEAAMATLRGDIDQVPPMFSALHHKGRRLHELAREGVEVERPPRRVSIHRFELLCKEGPKVDFEVHCSKGTYVRALVRDLGDALGCGAHLSALRRTQSGLFVLADVVELEEMGADVAERFVSLDRVLGHLPALAVAAEDLVNVRNGVRLRWADVAGQLPQPSGMFRVIGPGGALWALAQVDDGRLRYQRVMTSGLT